MISLHISKVRLLVVTEAQGIMSTDVNKYATENTFSLQRRKITKISQLLITPISYADLCQYR